MRAMLQSKLLRGQRRSIAIVGIGFALVALVVFLLGSNYISQLKLRDAILEQVKFDTDHSAEALSFFFKTTEEELSNLANANEFFAYSANKALGMSMQYGLRFSLLEISRLLARTARKGSDNRDNMPLFAWIAFIEDSTRRPLVIEPPPTTDNWMSPILSFQPPTFGVTFWIPTDREPASIYAALPYYFKGQHQGYLLAQLAADTLQARLISILASHKERRTCLVLAARCLRLLPNQIGADNWMPVAELPIAALKQPELLKVNAAMSPPENADEQPAAAKVSSKWTIPFYLTMAGIVGTPLTLAIFTPADRVTGQTDPALLLGLTGLLAGVILCGTFLLWRMDNQNLVLKMRVAEQKRRQEDLAEKNLQLYQLAHHDSLTGLPNRDLLFSRLEHAMVQARREGRQIALLFLDLDRFKTINDSLGHPVGDQVLQVIAQRLQDSVREADTVARLGGDEFLLLLEGVRKPDDAAAIARKILNLLMMKPLSVAERELFLTVSIGGSLFPEDGDTATELIRNADTAMYRAKEQGRNCYQRYERDLTARMIERFEIERGLRGAAERGEFQLYYQPQLSLTHDCMIGAEALLRWRHPQLGFISPGLFIPLAEETGHIHEIGAWVLHAACTQIHAWRQAGLAPPPIAINVSGQQIMRGDLPVTITALLTQWSIAPEQLELEITETSLMQHPAQALIVLNQLRKLGIPLAIDDFGTGYSSMSYMKRFKVDTLKIDKSFVDDLPDDEDDCSIARAIIALAHNLNLHVVAEGVETVAQRDFLQAEGCDSMQGYLFSKPMPPEEFERLLASGADRVMRKSTVGQDSP